MSAIIHPLPTEPTPQRAAPPAAPPRPKPRSPWRWIAIAVVLALCGWLAYRVLTPRTPQRNAPVPAVRTAKVFTGTLERSVRLAGQTAAINFANITAPVLRGPESRGSMVLLYLVKSGQWVKKGDKIAEIDAQSLRDHIDDVRDTLEAAEADVRKRQAEQMIEWEQLQQSLRIAEAEYNKLKLDARAASVRTEIEQQLIKLSVDEAEARVNQLKKDLISKKAAHAAELRILQLTVERHRRHLQRHEVDLKRFTIYAPMPGLAVMSMIFRGGEMAQIQQGDQVSPGMNIMKVVDTTKMQVEATVNQVDAEELRVSLPARITLDAFNNFVMPGKVHSIGALAVGGFRQNYYIRNVPVRINIEGSDPRLIPDLSAAVDVVLDRVENATLVPLGAVVEQNGKTYADVRSGEAFERREVTLGQRNNLYAVVTSGLKPGQEVRLN